MINPNDKQFPFLLLPGEGIGLEITPALMQLLNETLVLYNPELSFNFFSEEIGQPGIEKNGSALSAEIISLTKEFELTMKGPTATKQGKGEKSVNVQLRYAGDYYVCVRPIKHYPNVPTPYGLADKIDWVIFRENTEGLYGMPNLNYKDSQEFIVAMKKDERYVQTASQIERNSPYVLGFGVTSEVATKRLMRAAINWALEYKKPIVTITNKSNIFKELDGRFVDWCREVAEKEFADSVLIMPENVKASCAQADAEFEATGRITVDSCIADAFLEKSFKHPEDFRVIVANNYNGDLFSDYAAALVGGLGVAPGINVNFETGHVLAEATHGTAPDIVGKGIANPSSMLLSAIWGLRLQGEPWRDYADQLEKALISTFAKGARTGDLGGHFTTNGFLEKVLFNFVSLVHVEV